MMFTSTRDNGTHSTVAGMPSLEKSKNEVQLERGETITILANGRRVSITWQGSVVGVSDDETDDYLLLRNTRNICILGDEVHHSKTTQS